MIREHRSVSRAPQLISGITMIVVSRLRRFSRMRVAMIAGHGAAEADQHRDEALAVQADLVHDPVHHERGAGHVARVFENRDGQEQQQNVRQKDQRRRRRRR